MFSSDGVSVLLYCFKYPSISIEFLPMNSSMSFQSQYRACPDVSEISSSGKWREIRLEIRSIYPHTGEDR